MKKSNKAVEKIFKSKQERRRFLAKLPIEEKVKILVKLQKIASPVISSRNSIKKPWKI